MHSRKKGRRLNFLITAGGTREYIDPVRFISNASSGRMGYELVRAAKASGHNVTLITTIKNPQSAIRNPKLGIVLVGTADEMFGAVKRYFPKCDCLIMAAAVSDYAPTKTRRLKMKKSDKAMTLKLKPTPDILKWAGKNKKRNQVVAGFALEDRNVKAGAVRKMREKNIDIVIANRPSVIGEDKSSVRIKTKFDGWQVINNKTKHIIAKKIIGLVTLIFKRKVVISGK